MASRNGSWNAVFATLTALFAIDTIDRSSSRFLGEISEIETFAEGSAIREVARLRRVYCRGRWRKRKGVARVQLPVGSVHVAELHWYEAAGVGRKEFKIKRLF